MKGHDMIDYEGKSPLRSTDRTDLDSDLHAVAHGPRGRALAVGGIMVVVVVIGTLFGYGSGAFRPADPPAVMTGSPSPATNIPSLDRVTTTGQSLAPGSAQHEVDELSASRRQHGPAPLNGE